MKKYPCLFPVFLAFGALLAHDAAAKIWRVNNISNYNGTSLYGDNVGGSATFPVFNEIYTALNYPLFNAGDTLHVEGSAADYNNTVIYKKVVILGPGYFLSQNPKTSAAGLEARVGYIDLNYTPTSSSTGSQIIGMHVVNSTGIFVENTVSNITIKRCLIDYGISVGYGGSDLYITNNYFANLNNWTSTLIQTSSFSFASGNTILSNNIFKGPVVLNSGSTTYSVTECNNNTFDYNLTASGPLIRLNAASFKNNILRNVVATTVQVNNNIASPAVAYNYSTAGQFGNGVNNNLMNPASLFVSSASADGQYQLVAGTAAGSDGTDRGAYGGAALQNRYTPSGLPPIPALYDLTTTGVASPTTGLPVTIGTRTIK